MNFITLLAKIAADLQKRPELQDATVGVSWYRLDKSVRLSLQGPGAPFHMRRVCAEMGVEFAEKDWQRCDGLHPDNIYRWVYAEISTETGHNVHLTWQETYTYAGLTLEEARAAAGPVGEE